MKKVSILIVEDEIQLLERLSKYISIFCTTVYKATDGEEAFEIYKEYKPDIILSDLNLPKLSGIELIEKIREMDETTQIIILSAHTKTDNLLKAIKLKLVNYLIKPVPMDELKKTIFSAIDNISTNSYIELNNEYMWDPKTKQIIYKDRIIDLTTYEESLMDILITNLNSDLSYEELHNNIYQYNDFSQNSISLLVKRIRQKTTKKLIQSCFKYGYKIVSSSS